MVMPLFSSLRERDSEHCKEGLLHGDNEAASAAILYRRSAEDHQEIEQSRN